MDRKRRNSKKQNSKRTYLKYSDLTQREKEEEDRIVSAELAEIATHYGESSAHFGANRRHFGTFKATNQDSTNLKMFLAIVTLSLLKSSIKKSDPRKDIFELEVNTLYMLGITGILELLGHIVGENNKKKILISYMLYSVGNDILKI